jgi:N-acetylmuramic acid 6-phosphate (MurNAc-6-P) etherase
MATQSKWQSLPTEQINLASLAIDKMPPREIVDLMVNEDRKVVAAVQKEREKIAHGIEIITQALRKGGRHERTPGRGRGGRNAADLQYARAPGAGADGRRAGRRLRGP